MGRLRPDQCWQAFGPADIGPMLAVLDTVQFFTNPAGPYPFDVANSHFPKELQALVSTLDLGGESARVVFRRLAPGQGIPPHVDDWMPAEADWRRFQLPLVTDPRIVMRWPDDGQEQHLAAGILYEVRFDRTHEVQNNADVARIHIQIDQVNATI